MNSEDQKPQIAIIGIACWYPGAKNPLEFWENILSRRRQFRRMQDVRLPLTDYFDPDPKTPDKTYGYQAALIDGFEFDWIGHRIPKSTFESTDIVHWLAVDVAMKAMQDAGYDKDTLPKEKTGVILGNTLTGEYTRSMGLRIRWPYVRKTLRKTATSLNLTSGFIETFENYMEECFKSPFPEITEDTLAGGLSNTIAGRICNYLDLKGGGYTVDGACSSSLLAICHAADSLRNGNLDLAFCGGVDISLDTFEMIGFAKTGALTPDEMKVYDKNGKGFIPGEGCGFVVLKRLEEAIADQNYIYAIIRGWGIASDGRGGITAPSIKGQSLALRRAYERAGYSSREVDFIEGHGTGTVVGDPIEIEAIVLADDDHPKNNEIPSSNSHEIKKKKGITTLKSIIGHTKAAAGIGGLIKAAIAVNRRIIPPTAGISQPHPIFNEKAKNIYPILFGEIREANSKLRAGVSAMGFGGINTHVTIESAEAPSPKFKTKVDERALLVTNQETEVFFLTADSIEEMILRVEQLAKIATDISLAEMADLSYIEIQKADQKHKFRAAIVAATPRDLIARLELVQKMLSENPPAPNNVEYNPFKDVWIGNQVKKNRIGFLCSGQGAQQLNMGRTLVERYYWARELLSNVDNWIGEMDQQLLSGYIYLPSDKADLEQITEWKNKLTNTHVAQAAICLASLLWSERLSQLGITPVAVGGHSLGELTAFHLAGAMNEKELINLVALRGRAMSAPSDEAGTMVSFGCDLQTTIEINKELQGYWTVANLNSPSQTVIAGEKTTLQTALNLAKSKGVNAVALPVSNAFHSKFVHAAAEMLRKNACLPDRYSCNQIKLFSGIDGKQVRNAVDLKEYFAHQIISRVNFIGLVESIAKECDVLIEVGPGNILSNLVKSIINEKQLFCLPVESRSGMDRDFNTVLAACFVHGNNLQLESLFENRLIREFIEPARRKFIVNPCEYEQHIASLEAGHKTNVRLPFGFDDGFLQDIGVSNEKLDQYWTLREQFIKDIIRSDLKYLNTIPMVNAAAEQQKEDIKVDEQSTLNAVESLDLEHDVEHRIIELISEKTGFPSDSLSPNMLLLNDLNMESIKAGELIVNVAREYEVQGLLDPAKLAQSTIHEVASAITEAKKGSAGALSSLSNIQQLIANIEKSSGSKTWVRNFIIEPVREELAQQPSPESWKIDSVLILHEENDRSLVEEIGQRLQKNGGIIHSATFSTSANAPLKEDYSVVIGVLPRKIEDDFSQESLQKAVDRLHKIAQIGVSSEFALNETGQPARQSLIIVQFTGGKFGIGNNTIGVEQGGSLSFTASIHHEKPHLFVRSLDFASSLSDKNIAQCIFEELQSEGNYGLAGYDDRINRYVPRPVLQNPEHYSDRKILWCNADVVLVTGGARGITAQCAFEIAKKTGAKMALLGSSPLPLLNQDQSLKPEILQTLDNYANAGLTCKYYQCDVTNAESVTKVIKVIEDELGAISGVIHGAGTNTPKHVETVSLAEAQQEIAPKLLGACNIIQALNNKPPKIFIGLSSIIGVTGMPGNAWYAFSNEMLDLLLHKFHSRHPDMAALCIAYSVWDEIGMGARLGSIHTLASMGISAIPLQEGIQRFAKLFFYDAGCRQIIVAARLGGLDTWRPEIAAKPQANRFLQNIELFHPGVEVAAKIHLELESHPYLKDHCYEGSYLFPAVFGLEAMAQAVALAVGKTVFSSLSLVDVRFERPIVVDPQRGLEILIYALVAEQNGDEQFHKVQVGISTELSGFLYNHFAAVFHIPIESSVTPVLLEKELTKKKALEINPKVDLYGSLLFQGPLFQRLHEFYVLNTQYCECSSSIRKYQSQAENEVFILGDPYFRDSILQVGQVIAARDKALPKSISQIDIYPAEIAGEEAIIMGELIERTDVHWLSIFTVADQSGHKLERLQGCEFAILETKEDGPMAEDMACPDARDNQLLQRSLSRLSAEFGVSFPKIKITNIPNLHELKIEERHKQLMPFVEHTLTDYFAAQGVKNKPNFKLTWLQSGKPYVKVNNHKLVQVSISHDERFCLTMAGIGDLGCDIMSLEEKSSDNWKELLGPNYHLLFEQLAAQENKDYAGSKIWTAKEALYKALNSNDMALTLASSSNSATLFIGRVNGYNYRIITFPMWFTLGAERILAMVLEIDKAEKKSDSLLTTANLNFNLFQPHYGKKREKLLREFGYNPQTYMMDADVDEETMSLIIRWPLTLREAANLSRGIYFSTYAEWLGMVREVGTQPINDKLLPQLATGKWGLVTNESEIEIFGDWTPTDTIQVRLWITPDSKLPDSTLNLYYDWQKVTTEGVYERLALGYLRASFVEILGHGKVSVTKLPDYFQEFIRKMQRPAKSIKMLDHIPERLKGLSHGAKLYQKPEGPLRGPLLSEKIIETTLLESNMVGNVYFSNYYKWQGIVRDSFFFNLIPEHFQQTYSTRELRCIKTRINHLCDTMPFAKIIVRMHLDVLYTNGCELGFDYFQQLPNNKEIKLALGQHLAFWIDRSSLDSPLAVQLPEKALKSLLAACGQ